MITPRSTRAACAKSVYDSALFPVINKCEFICYLITNAVFHLCVHAGTSHTIGLAPFGACSAQYQCPTLHHDGFFDGSQTVARVAGLPHHTALDIAHDNLLSSCPTIAAQVISVSPSCNFPSACVFMFVFLFYAWIIKQEYEFVKPYDMPIIARMLQTCNGGISS